jgi:creatinine amidohydrolase
VIVEYQSLKGDEVKGFLRKETVVLLPVGAVEFHAAHLPLGTDNYLAEEIARKVAEKLGEALILPPLSYGQVWSLRDFPGSLNISNEVLSGLIVDIGRSLYNQGIRILTLINSHMGNLDAMKDAARVLFEVGMKVLYLTYPGVEAVQKQVLESPKVHGTYFHACEIETSYMLYLAPQYVDMEKAICDHPAIPVDFNATPTPWNKITKTAVLGDATLATPDKGKAMIDAVVDNMVEIIHKVRREIQSVT